MKSDKQHGTEVKLVKDIIYKVVDIKEKKIKQDCDNPKVFYIHKR